MLLYTAISLRRSITVPSIVFRMMVAARQMGMTTLPAPPIMVPTGAPREYWWAWRETPACVVTGSRIAT